jgi:hypothetical protein
MDAETSKAIDGIRALIEVEVLRLHLKIRRHSRATDERLAALEKHAGVAHAPACDAAGGAQ